MNFEDLQRANELIQTMTFERYNRKTGKTTRKEYAEVNQRVKAFRSVFPEGQIIPELIKDDGERVQFKVTITNGEKILAIGHAEEIRNSSDVNTTSCLENCETSATGRALGMCGFGIDTSIASFEEVSSAIMKQEGMKLATDTEKAGFVASCNAKGLDYEFVLKEIGFDRNKQPEGMTVEKYGKAMEYVNKYQESDRD